MQFSTIEILMYITVSIVAGLIYVLYVKPRYFDKAPGPEINNPKWRSRAILIDKNVPGVISEIDSRINHPNNTVVLRLSNENGRFIKEYHDGEIVALDKSQIMADKGSPVFITTETKYSELEIQKDLENSNIKTKRALSEADHWRNEYESLSANVEARVDTEVNRFIETNKSKFGRDER